MFRDDTVKSSSLNPLMKVTDTIDLVKEIRYPYKEAKVIFNYEKNTPRFEFWYNTQNGTLNSKDGYYFYSKLNTIQFVEAGKAKLYKFDYSYFHTPNSISSATETSTRYADADDMYSLKLKALTVLNPETGYTPLYTFGYNDNKARRFAKGLDYYGYFKGGSKWTGTQNIPYAQIAGHSIYGLESREPDSAHMQWGILKTVTSGSGGKLSFEFGIHRLQELSGPLTTGANWVGKTLVTIPGNNAPGYIIGDGLKLNSVMLEDKNDVHSRKVIKYNYQEGQFFLPGGIFVQPTYFMDKFGNTVMGHHTYETFMNPGYFHNGTNHSYGKVEERVFGWQDQQLQAKEYMFTNFAAGPSKLLVTAGGQQNVGFPFTQKQYIRAWEIGLPTLIKIYDDKDLIVEEQTFNYQFVLDTTSSLNAQVTDTNRVVTDIVNAPTIYDYFDVIKCINVLDYKVTKDPYRPYKGLALLKETTTKKYISNSSFITETSIMDYDSRYNLKSVRNKNSKNEYIENYTLYNYDLNAGSNPALVKMQQEGSEYIVGSEVWNNGTANPNIRNANSKLLKASVLLFENNNNAIHNKKVLESSLEAPMPYSTYMSGSVNGVAAPIVTSYAGGTPNAYMEVVTEVMQRDAKGNPLETFLPQSNIYKSTIWDTYFGEKVADVVNARYSDIAYAGFEIANENNVLLGSESYILNIDDNGLLTLPSNFTGSIPVNSVLLGNQFCLIKTSSASVKNIYTQSLQANKKYRATFWCSSNSLPQFGIEGGAQFALTEIAVKGQYKQYEVIFTPTASNQKIGLNTPNANVAIDELRIHPFDANMTTYTYKGLVGKVSETNALGRITFFEYDALGRLKLVRDQEGNIIEKKAYGIQTID
jgi:YD repeat-containing protein